MKLAREWKLAVEVLEQKDMEKARHGLAALGDPGIARTTQVRDSALLGGGKRERPVVLVGKGITFDTGGISSSPQPKWTR